MGYTTDKCDFLEIYNCTGGVEQDFLMCLDGLIETRENDQPNKCL